MNPNITATKFVDLHYAAVGNTVTYRVRVSNNGDTPGINVNLTDLIPQGANFIDNSININGTTILNVNPALGIDLSTIPISSTTTVTFKSLVVNIPVDNPMVNYAQLDYQYNSSSTSIPSIVTNSIDSNNVTTTILNGPNIATLNAITKYVSPVYATTGDTLTYTIVIPNNGNTVATNVLFVDTIPLGTSFIPNTLTVNGTTISSTPNNVNIGSISSGNVATVSFKVRVN